MRGKSQAARKVLKAVKRLLDDIAIPGIRDYGISREQFLRVFLKWPETPMLREARPIPGRRLQLK